MNAIDLISIHIDQHLNVLLSVYLWKVELRDHQNTVYL